MLINLKLPFPPNIQNACHFLGNNCLADYAILTTLLSFTFTKNVFCSVFWLTQQIFFSWILSVSWCPLSPEDISFHKQRRGLGPMQKNHRICDSQMVKKLKRDHTSHVGYLQMFERLINHHSLKNRFMLYFCPEKSTKELPI